jgi:hypothetical protein
MLFSKDEWPGGKNLAISPKIWREMFRRIPSPSFGLNYALDALDDNGRRHAARGTHRDQAAAKVAALKFVK